LFALGAYGVRDHEFIDRSGFMVVLDAKTFAAPGTNDVVSHGNLQNVKSPSNRVFQPEGLGDVL
jgi:hypothetical protein